MSRRPAFVGAWSVAAALLATTVSACAPDDTPTPAATSTPTSTQPPVSTTSTTTTPSTTRRAPTRTKPPARRTTTTSHRAPQPQAKPVPRPSSTAARCAVPAGVTATQVVLVKAAGASATVRACRRVDGVYRLELGPYAGHVGRNGVSWSKREGDLRTPAGTFPLRGGFGARGNPGLATGWFRVDANDVWVDDPGSTLYNTHQRKPADGRWSSAEDLLNRPAYTYAQVVGYNEARTPGKGSAIFLHVDLGHGTAGCVSLPEASLLAVLRWERPGAVMSIS